MSVWYYKCENCREIGSDHGFMGRCKKGHDLCECCESLPRDDDGHTVDCPVCAKGGTPLEKANALLLHTWKVNDSLRNHEEVTAYLRGQKLI